MFQGDTMGTVLIQVVERPWIQESRAKSLPMLLKYLKIFLSSKKSKVYLPTAKELIEIQIKTKQKPMHY